MRLNAFPFLAPLAPLALVSVFAAPLGAQIPHTLDVDPAQSNAVWDGQTSVGPVNGNQNFQLGGTVGLSLASGSAPFGDGQFNGGELISIPATLSGEIPNPIPLLPPLATIDLNDLQAATTSLPFSVGAATGFFSTVATMEFTGGDIVIDPLVGGAVTIPMDGLLSDPFPVDGNLTEVNGNVVVDAPLAIYFVINVGVTGTFSILGDIHAEVPVGNYGMDLTVSNFNAGQTADIEVSGGLSNAQTYLFYSLNGVGNFFVPELNVILGISTPILGAGPDRSDANGGCALVAADPDRRPGSQRPGCRRHRWP